MAALNPRVRADDDNPSGLAHSVLEDGAAMAEGLWQGLVGVRVGQVTLIEGVAPQQIADGPVGPGVTAILPPGTRAGTM